MKPLHVFRVTLTKLEGEYEYTNGKVYLLGCARVFYIEAYDKEDVLTRIDLNGYKYNDKHGIVKVDPRDYPPTKYIQRIINEQ
jgi:hypothetical protein